MQEVRVVTLRRAADILGGEEALALHLGITPSHLALWIRTLADMPDGVFLRAVDIVLEHDLARQLPDSSADQGTRAA